MDKMIIGGSTKKRFHCGDIIRMLESFIVDNEIRGGTMLPNLSTLASQFSVSSSTMQRAMDVLARRKVIYRVRGQGSFVCEKVKPRWMSSVAMLRDSGDWQDSLGLNYYAYDRFSEIITKRLREEENCKVTLFHVNMDWINSGKAIGLNLFDCVIVSAGLLKHFPQLFDEHRKIILVEDSEYHRGDFNQTLLDYTPAFRKALRHYRERGIKRFFAAGRDAVTSIRRFEALVEAGEQEGYSPSDFMFYGSPKTFSPVLLAPGMDCGERYFALNDADCGVISLSDYIVVGMMEAFARRGLTLGVDVPAASYDNLLRFIPELHDRVTFDCIEHPLEELAVATVELCHALLRSKERSFSGAFTVPATVFIPHRADGIRPAVSTAAALG